MDPSIRNQLATQLALSIPLFLVLLVGVILAVVLWRRCTMACVLVLCAAALIGAAAVVFPVVQFRLIDEHQAGAMDTQTLSSTLSVLGVVVGALRTVGLALLVAAVFVGRKAPAV